MVSQNLQSAFKFLGLLATQRQAEFNRQLAPVFNGYAQEVNRSASLMFEPWRQYSQTCFKHLAASLPKFELDTPPVVSSVEAWIEEVLLNQSANERMLHCDGQSFN